MTPEINKELARIESKLDALIDEALKLHYHLERVLNPPPAPRPVLHLPLDS